MTRTLFVDRREHRVGYVPNGTLDSPYDTIQDAVDAAATMTPSATNPIVIAILQGIYEENVFVGYDGLCLRGLGDAGTVRISPATGPALVVSNTTPALVQDYIASGANEDPPNPSILNGSAVASPLHSLRVVDLYLGTQDPASQAVYVVGNPKGQPLGDEAGKGITFSNCIISYDYDPVALQLSIDKLKTLHAYFCHYVKIRHNSEINGPTTIFNCGGFFINDSAMVGLTLNYDPEHDLGVPSLGGFPGGHFGLVARNAELSWVTTLTTTTLTGIAAGGVQPTMQSTFEDLRVLGTSTFNMIGGYVNSITVGGDATWHGQDVHVQGPIILNQGPGHVQLDGGRHMVSAMDPAGKFQRNPGS